MGYCTCAVCQDVAAPHAKRSLLNVRYFSYICHLQAGREQPQEGGLRVDDPEVQRLKKQAGQLTPMELFERLQSLQRAPAAAVSSGASSSAAAAGGGGAAARGVQQLQPQQQHQQQQPVVRQQQPAAGAIKPPAPPPGSPPKQQQQQQMVPPGPAPGIQYVQQQVFAGYAATVIQTPTGPVPGPPQPIYQTVMHPVAQPPMYGVGQTWQQQQQQGYAGNGGYTWQQQQHSTEQQYEGDADQGECDVGESGENGDWGGETWPDGDAGEDEGDWQEGMGVSQVAGGFVTFGVLLNVVLGHAGCGSFSMWFAVQKKWDGAFQPVEVLHASIQQ